ncbi:MAG: HD domain-containing protein [Candidatus Bathyarchaeia archaeon]
MDWLFGLLEGRNMDSRIVEKIRKLVEEECKKDTNTFGDQIWTYHILSVVRYGKFLARKLHADEEIVEIAALLHDIAGIKDRDNYENHHLLGAEEAEKILKRFKYPQEKIEKVKHCIYSHRGSKAISRETLEAKCVASADAMAHFDRIPALLYFVFVRLGMDIDEGTKWLRDKLNRSWSKLIPEAKEIVRDKYEATKIIF